MVDPNTRQGKRTPVTLKIKFKSETLEQFIERYAVDVSQGGIFIRTKEPLAVGTQMKFEFQLRDASPLIAGEGTVVWTRENDPSRPAIAPGMGVRFDRLADGSQGILERILTEKAKQAPQRPTADTAKPPLFTDAPTRVAPAPVQEALLGKDGGPRRRDDGGNDSHTPLPRPMPFHSDADEFPDEAFEEATKVRALDELIAQTAEGGSSADELAARRPSGRDSDAANNEVTKVAAHIVEPDDLPSPPEPVRPQPKLLDTSPSPRIEPAAESSTRMKSSTGPERGRATPPAGQPALEAPPLLPSNVRAVTAEQTEPARLPAVQSRSKAPLLVFLLLLIAAGGAAAWFFVIRPGKVAEQAATAGSQDVGSAGALGSAGSAVAIATGSGGSATGSAGSAGSDQATTAGSAAPAEVTDTVIAASVENATVAIAGTDQTGPAPFTAKLEKGKSYKAKVTAKGFLALELDVKGGDDKQTAKLVAKPRVISVQSEPSGALIFVDSSATGHTTPYEVELTAAQSAKRAVRIQLRKSGYRSLERVVELAKMKEDDERMTAKLSERLSVPQAPTPVHTGPGPGSGSAGAGQGSDGTGAGSDAPAPTPTPTDAPSGTTPGSAAEPEPEFNKQP